MTIGALDAAIVMACVAGLGTMLVFFGVHQVTHSEVSLADRLSGWGIRNPRAVTPARSRVSIGGRLEGAVSKHSFAASIQRDLARANIKLTVPEFLLGHLTAVAGGAAVGFFVGGVPLAAVLGVVGFYLPRLVVSIAQRRRMKAFGDQLSDTLMLMSNSLRAGFSLLQSMETVAREAPEPNAEEFGRVVREVGLGLTPEHALQNLYRRLPSEDMDLMVTAITVQHEVGGNLAKIFDTLGETIRERRRIQGEIQTLTAQQRFGGIVISGLPVALTGVMFLINPTFFDPFMSSEKLICMPAFMFPVCAALMVVAGYATMKKLVAIEV